MDTRKSGVNIISDLTTSFTRESSNSSYDSNFTWAGGAPTESANNASQNFAKSPGKTGIGDSASLTVPATTNLYTLYIFAGVAQSGATLDVSLGDTSATAVSDAYDAGGGYGHIVYKIDYFADSNTDLNVSWSKTETGTAASHIRFQGAALTVPEPSTALLSVTALGLLALRRKR